MSDLDQLRERVLQHIPVTRGLAFAFCDYQAGVLEMEAPIDGHINDKGTFFAGSQAALFTLAGWALTTLEAEQHHGAADVVAVSNELKYTAPLQGDMVIRVTAEEASLARFHEHITRRGRARLVLDAQGLSRSGDKVSHWSGHYLARLLGGS